MITAEYLASAITFGLFALFLLGGGWVSFRASFTSIRYKSDLIGLAICCVLFGLGTMGGFLYYFFRLLGYP